jgi:DNA-binding XRE family transcriptional regulator
MNDPLRAPAFDPEVPRLLRGIVGCLQRIEGELRDIRLRLNWAPQSNDAPNQPPGATRPGRAAPFRVCSARVPAGKAASERLSAVRRRCGQTQAAFARRLGVSASMVGMIEAGRCGISARVDAALRRLGKETKP